MMSPTSCSYMSNDNYKKPQRRNISERPEYTAIGFAFAREVTK